VWDGIFPRELIHAILCPTSSISWPHSWSKMHWNCVPLHWHQINYYVYCSEENTTPSSDSLLKTQDTRIYSSETLLPRPHYVSLPLWKPIVKNLKIEITKVWRLHAGETYKYYFMSLTSTVFNTKPLLCFSFFYSLIWNKKVKNVTQLKVLSHSKMQNVRSSK